MPLEGDSSVTAPLSQNGSGMAAAQAKRRFRYSEAPATAVLDPEIIQKSSAALPSLVWKPVWLALAAAALCIVLFYPTDLYQLVIRWASDAGWSHGFVVPVISAFFVYLKWESLKQLTPAGSLWGIAILMAGIIGQILFRATGLSHMSNLSLLVVLFGIMLFVFGWEYLKLLWLPISFLVFAIPPPDSLYVRLTTPMQSIAAQLGVWVLTFFGFAADKMGTLININGLKKPLNVAEACAGMRLLIGFLALAVALGYSTNRPTWQKVLLAGFALPIAIFCNGCRVAFTGVMSVEWGEQWGQGTPHQFLGLLMLVPAMIILVAIGWALDRIFIEIPEQKAGEA